MLTKGAVLAAGASAETTGSNMEINVGLMLSLMEKHGAHSEILTGQTSKSVNLIIKIIIIIWKELDQE